MLLLPGNPREPWRRRNPRGQVPTRFVERPRVHVRFRGQSPGTMEYDEETGELAAGLVRRLWRQVVAGTPAPPPFEWSRQPAVFTRAIRYRAQSLYLPAGTQNTRLSMLHTRVRQVSRQPRPMLEAGTRRGRPVVRNRMSSFGSRVAPLNRRVAAAQGDKQ